MTKKIDLQLFAAETNLTAAADLEGRMGGHRSEIYGQSNRFFMVCQGWEASLYDGGGC